MVIHHLNDFLLTEQSGTPPADLDRLRIVFSKLNVPIAEHKVEGPAHSITFLGVSLDMRAIAYPPKN